MRRLTPPPIGRSTCGRGGSYPLQLCLAWILSLSIRSAASLNPIVIRGYKLFDSQTGDEFTVRGITYEPRPNRVPKLVYYFTEEHRHIWERDIPNLQSLGVNAVRLSGVDPTKNHDAFMCALQQAGIYVLVPLDSDCPTCAITRDEPPACYPDALMRRGEAVINAFAKYDNVLGFSAGNEVTPANIPQWNGPCQKRFIRDMRRHIASCPSMRKIPVGLMNSNSERDLVSTYYNCGSNDPKDPYENAEWFGLNVNLHCDGDEQQQAVKNLLESYPSSIPVMVTGLGCTHANDGPNQLPQEGQLRTDQAQWLLENQILRDQFAGGFAFEYSISIQNDVADAPYPSATTGGQHLGVGKTN
jgi:1,3-beta-glucanosyltransferase GAS5